MTEIKIIREIFNDACTIGRLYVNGDYRCYTLEDRCREQVPGTWNPALKVRSITAIPYGRYELTVTFSERFGRALPLLLNVPDFVGVRIHPGNSDKDTEGCILVGDTKSAQNNAIGNSRLAFSLLFLEIQREILKGKIFVKISDAQNAPVEKK